MITDPYSVLGVSPNASNDEVKKAYRELSRKYHPDSYADNPLASLAEEKFKEVQEAYDLIMKQREGEYGGGAGFGGYSSQSSYHTSDSDSVELQVVVNYINSRHFREALNVLNGITGRDARWFYYSAVANAGLGNNVIAQQHAQQAVNMDPSNREYVTFLNDITFRSQRYQNTGYNNGRQGDYGMSNFCCDLWCADTLCECMGGDLCSCI